MDTIKPLFTATATATGGRNGHTQAGDGSASADLSVPKAMGGPGKPGTTTPEPLFAAGYAASAARSTSWASSTGRTPARRALPPTCRSDRVTAAGFGVAVKLRVEDKTLPQAELVALAEEAHEKICPYSHAIRGNVDVQLEIEGA